MTTTLEDIRVGDIMLLPFGIEEARVSDVRPNAVEFHGQGRCAYLPEFLRNPELRVGDKVRIRGGSPNEVFPWNGKRARPDNCYALVERAQVAEKKPLIMTAWMNNAGMAVDRWSIGIRPPVRLATVKPSGGQWISCFDGTETAFCLEREAKAYADKWLAREGWVEEGARRHRTIAEYLLDPKTKTNTPRCTLCGHANPRHYASCEHHPEPKGTLISTLGWDQPAPIVVLCQNEEDVP